MLRQAYIAISLSKRQFMQVEIESICEVLVATEIAPFVFVDAYQFTPADAKAMMHKAREHLDKAEILIAELTHKAIGVGVEAGYMAAQGKPIIYLRRDTSEYSTTVGGLADFEIVYHDVDELKKQLKQIIKHI